VRDPRKVLPSIGAGAATATALLILTRSHAMGRTDRPVSAALVKTAVQ
jgi:hypothetical protein